jgi:uncharacterized Zn finger protein (UPF0148 family)
MYVNCGRHEVPMMPHNGELICIMCEAWVEAARHQSQEFFTQNVPPSPAPELCKDTELIATLKRIYDNS